MGAREVARERLPGVVAACAWGGGVLVCRLWKCSGPSIGSAALHVGRGGVVGV